MPKQNPMYTGFKMPNGLIPSSIMNNGQLRQDYENVALNSGTYYEWLLMFMNISMSVFEWTNLPDGIDTRMMELWITQNGFGVFFKDDDLIDDPKARAPEGYAFLQAMIGGQWDMYNLPETRRAYAVNGLNVELNEENSVLIFDNELRVNIFPTIDLMARRVAEIDRTIDVNVRAQKTPKIIRCSDKQRLTFKNMMMDVDGNVYTIFADKNVSLDGIDVLDMSAPYVASDLMALKRQYINECLTYLGVENTTTEKKERLITNEVMTNMGFVETMRFTRLNSRKRACDEINKLFGLDIDCNFRSGVYVKADGYGAQDIATSGMQDTITPTDAAGYNDIAESSGVLARIRRLLGM